MARADYYNGLTIEADESLRRLTIDGCSVEKVTKGEDGLFFVPGIPEARSGTIYQLGRRMIGISKKYKRRRKIRNDHVDLLKRGVACWNDWRSRYPEIRPLLFDADLRASSLHLSDLNYVNFANANLIEADLREMKLIGANFHEANLGGAKLHKAVLTRANLCRTDLYVTQLQGANLRKANLQGTQLAKTKFQGAKLDGCKVYGMSAWDLELDQKTVQKNLIIRYGEGRSGDLSKENSESQLLVDNLQMAQFMYMLLNNASLRDVIGATTAKVVLILGRFTPKRLAVLTAARNALRDRWGYVPVLFNFPPSPNRDLTETIQLLAGLAKFIIADLTDPKSIPQELSNIVPYLPSLPIQPIVLSSRREYGMFEHWRRYPWVLPEFLYESEDHLLAHLGDKIIAPVENCLKWTSPQVPLKAAMLEIEELKRKVAVLEKAVAH